jgi:hypothetical protein
MKVARGDEREDVHCVRQFGEREDAVTVGLLVADTIALIRAQRCDHKWAKLNEKEDKCSACGVIATPDGRRHLAAAYKRFWDSSLVRLHRSLRVDDLPRVRIGHVVRSTCHRMRIDPSLKGSFVVVRGHRIPATECAVATGQITGIEKGHVCSPTAFGSASFCCLSGLAQSRQSRQRQLRHQGWPGSD